MKYKHTPGPWTAFQDYPRRHTVGTATGRICDMWGQDPAFYTDEDEANARLIASAPDLLAIVQFIAREHRDGAQEVYFGALFNDDDITTLGDAVTTAIAKATTGQEEEALSAALDEAIEVVSDLPPRLNAAMAHVCTCPECDGTNLDPTATTCRDCSASDHAEGATQ